MDKTSALTRILAVAGTVLAWFPTVATAAASVARMSAGRVLHVDYLMPAELFPAALVGGLLLLWAALRARSRRKLVAWSLGLIVGLLAGGQALAVATGLASGATAPTGWPLSLVLASIVGYTLALMALGVAGALLIRDTFLKTRSPDTHA